MCIILRRGGAGAIKEHKCFKWKLSLTSPEKQTKINKQTTKQKAKMGLSFCKVSGELNNEAVTDLPTIEADQITQACKTRGLQSQIVTGAIWWERNSVPDSL